jgi:CHAT domain-containing protein
MLAGGGDLDGALRETRLALHYAQQNRIGDLSYVWQHQTGRVLRKQGHTAKAIEMYRAAARNLNLLRKGLPADCGLAEGAFQETVKPVYLELAELLIDSSAGSSDRNEEQRLLMEARQTVESLRAEELRDYFADACLGAERSDRMRLDATPPNTAIFYIVNFPDRLELLVSFPDGIKRVKVAESSATVGREARLLRLTMENRFPVWTVPAGKLYDWLIRPVEADLKRNDVRTIVFVPDGPLRNIPLSVLHDGKRSIINSYAVATIQGLGFTSGNSDASLKKAGILLAGISESVQGYPALSNVQDELSGIRMSHAGSMLLNSDFNVQRVKELLDASSYPLIHFASHGEFTGDARNNYILTWDGRMTLDHLDSFIRKSATRKAPVAVLALSACRTAAGDDRASLGLAGLAVKSGAHSAVASLWDIDDKSTAELFVEFYRILGGGGSVSRAEALRGAQLHIQKKYEHPYYWSPFLLIGDWF